MKEMLCYVQCGVMASLSFFDLTWIAILIFLKSFIVYYNTVEHSSLRVVLHCSHLTVSVHLLQSRHLHNLLNF